MEPINPNRTTRWTRVCSLDHLVYGHQPFAERRLWNIDRGSASLRLDVEGPDDLAPLFAVVSDELAEIGGRANERRAAELGELGGAGGLRLMIRSIMAGRGGGGGQERQERVNVSVLWVVVEDMVV